MKSKAFNNNALFTMVAVVTMMIASPIVVLVEARIGNTNGLHSSIINHQTGSSTGMGTRHRATTRTFAENIFTNKSSDNIFTNNSSGVSNADEIDTPTTKVATTTVTATKQTQKQLKTNGNDNKPLPSYEEVMHNAKATPGHGQYVDQANGKNLASFCGRHNKFNKSDCYQHHDALRGKGHQEEEHQHQRGD
mmetsp:Transcript_11381/g.13098  ORF Transcript_11381/g.13098 Transcript_11381/m.13098 type:complete len:192 (+) Transcript_11381:198-773(+)